MKTKTKQFASCRVIERIASGGDGEKVMDDKRKCGGGREGEERKREKIAGTK